MALFANSVNSIFLVRHAETIKNIKNIHGGSGDFFLTSKGIEQLDTISERLIASNCNNSCSSIIYHSNSVQTRDTASGLADIMGLKTIETSLLNSVYLGKLNGLSDEEAKQFHPVEYAIMSEWRERKIEITALIPIGLEDPFTYWDKGIKFISSLNKNINIVVCSTSAMIMLSHLLTGHSPLAGGGYMHIPMGNAQILCFNIDDGKAHLNEHISDSDLIGYLS